MKRFIIRTQKSFANLRPRRTQSPSRSIAEPVTDVDSFPREGPAIGKLPVELLLHIFSHCEPQVKHRLRLTHACQHWSFIVTNTAHLWTNVEIGIGPSADDRTFYNFTSLLSLQLDRAARLPLNVFWHVPLDGPFNVDMLEFLRLKVPFVDWQSLILRTEGAYPSEESLGPSDVFPRLESLTIQGYPTNHIIGRVVTTSFNLRILDIQATRLDAINLEQLQAIAFRLYPSRALGVTEILYGDAIERIFRLILPPESKNLPSDGDLALPSNVTHLQVPFRETHVFPHITSYALSLCIFTSTHLVDLRNLTTLMVSTSLQVASGCQIVLPRLLYLKFPEISLSDFATMQAPTLEHLHICTNHNFGTKKEHIRGAELMVRHPGYLLSPKRFLRLDLCLSAAGIIHCLEQSPSVEYVTISFRDESIAWQTIDNIFGASSSVDGTWALPDPSAADVCPNLRELRLNFHSKLISSEVWRLRAAFEVEQRRDQGRAVSIYGSWGGEEVCILLA